MGRDGLMENREFIRDAIMESIAVKQLLLQTEAEGIARAADWIVHAFRSGGKLILFGNGGSAADAQHIAAELEGRFEKERRSLPALALTTNSSTLTAVANDYHYRNVFSRPIEAWARPEDVVIGISTSGNSINVLEGITAAKMKGARTIGLTGEGGGKLASVADLCIKVPSSKTTRIQESHIMIGHILCQAVDREF